MHKLYMNFMSLVRKFGRPDLFVTFTMNANCDEIFKNLFPGQQPTNRPELIAKVFALMLHKMIESITKESFPFGQVIAWCYTIEYQKRGLPHAHCLFWLSESYKPRNADLIDELISAELPEDDPELFELVTKYMMHECKVGRCKENSKCAKNFPMKYQEMTNANIDGFPAYRRCNRAIVYKGQIFDNAYVVPYNSTLLKMLKLNFYLHFI